MTARDKPIFDLQHRTSSMLRIDLEAAGIPYVDGDGLYLDIHSLRHTYVTHLAASGMSPAMVQKLARHADINLTMNRYCHADRDQTRDALDGTTTKKGE